MCHKGSGGGSARVDKACKGSRMSEWSGQVGTDSGIQRAGLRDRLGFGTRRARVTWAALTLLGLMWCDGAQATEPKVILLRGWFGVFSTGLDSLARDLKAKGINAEVSGHLYWGTAVADILRDRAAGKIYPIVLVGHSQGANNVIDMAQSLEERGGVPVDLVVTLAPFLQSPIPSNVVHAVNYYQAPGWGMALSTAPGFHGKLDNVDVSNDWGITHITIDKDSRIHSEIVHEVVALAAANPGNDPGAAGKPGVAPPARSAEKKAPKRAPQASKDAGTPNSPR
jgi:hypothetical protein